MNFRYSLLKWTSILSGNGIFRAYQQTLHWDKSNPKEIKEKQQRLLKKILVHAFHHVPYYRKTLNEYGVYKGQEIPELSRFEQLPFLTKDIIREQFDQLLSDDWHQRGGQYNTSGGSTGEPVQFVQDNEHRCWSVYANKLYYNHVLGKFPGERELLLWGSDRDILRGSIGIKAQLTNLIYNRRFLNAYRMSPETMKDYIYQINTFQPVSIWAYVESLELLARFADEEGLEIIPPKMVISTAGTLHSPARALIERVFDAPLYNQYGSREVGPIACQCRTKDHLHLFPWTHFVEVVNECGAPTPAGEEGEIVITSLVNHAMPLIRFKIGDRAIVPARPCACGREILTLKHITGRTYENLTALDGTRIYGHYFTTLFFNRSWVKTFQVVQTRKDQIINRIVTHHKAPKSDLEEILARQRQILGGSVDIQFEIVDEIIPTASGKYIYIINKTGKNSLK